MYHGILPPNLAVPSLADQVFSQLVTIPITAIYRLKAPYAARQPALRLKVDFALLHDSKLA